MEISKMDNWINEKVCIKLKERLDIITQHEAKNLDSNDIDEIHHIYEVFKIMKDMKE